jgi:hypothetical protein
LVPFKNQQKILISYGFQIRILIFEINISTKKQQKKSTRKSISTSIFPEKSTGNHPGNHTVLSHSKSHLWA